MSGGTQCITITDDHAFPLNIKSGLHYMNIRPWTDDEWNTLPHIILISYNEWDPTILDCSIGDDDADNDDWYDEISDISTRHNDALFDSTGEYKYRYIVYGIDINNHYLENWFLPTNSIVYDVNEHESYNIDENIDPETQITTKPREIRANEPAYKISILHFSWQPIKIIKKIFNSTIQYIRKYMNTHHTRNFRSPFPALNIPRFQESVATDTIYANIPAIYCGHTIVSFYCGINSQVFDVYGIKTY